MSDGFMLYLDDNGVARHYDDTYDITIHCESEEEQQKAIEQLKSLQWIPCSERLPKKTVDVLQQTLLWVHLMWILMYG